MTSKRSFPKPGSSTTKGSSKFGNQPFWINILTGQTCEKLTVRPDANWTYFDSRLEFSTWMQLRQICQGTDITIIRQHRFCLAPGNNYFAPLTWDCDFLLSGNKVFIPIECKGKWLLYNHGELSAFRHLLRAFHQHSFRWFEDLLIVDNEPWNIPGIANKSVIAKSELSKWLNI